MFFYLIIALVAGFLLSNQTPINTDLRRFTKSPILSGLISFAVGTIFLALISLITTGQLIPSLVFIQEQPLWIWLGGLLGAIYLTSNILLLPRLGALQTVILPIFGQIIMGTIIDSFALFGAQRIPLSLMRVLGLILLVIGVMLAVLVPALIEKRKMAKLESESLTGQENLMLWRTWAVLIGFMAASQQAINGHLGVLLHNTADASFISFFIGTFLILIVALIVEKRLPKPSDFKKAKPWDFLGGILGSLFVFATVITVPEIGAGLTIMMGLMGQILGSMLVQAFGWWKSPKAAIQRVQILGLVVMLLGIVFIKFL